jgi:dihydroflavonol-4-reductase
MGDRVLVTGASGVVGSAVARALSRRGDDVRVLMRSTSPHSNREGETFAIAAGDESVKCPGAPRTKQ